MAINGSSASANPDSGDDRTFSSSHQIFLVDPSGPTEANSWAHKWNSACNKSITYWALIPNWNVTYAFKSDQTGGSEITKAELVLWPGVHIARINHNNVTANVSFTPKLYKDGAYPYSGVAYTIGS
tara:strand:- start:1697 stop:2074 length:378 start_codon:yes stop_codon:yes gene_type:complete